MSRVPPFSAVHVTPTLGEIGSAGAQRRGCVGRSLELQNPVTKWKHAAISA
jgi:hypothetical protein